MMRNQTSQRTYSQRQLRVGELVKQNLGELLIRNEAKIPLINSKLITVTEVRMTPDLKTARVYVIPLGGEDTKETVRILTENSHLVRRALSKRLDIKFLPKLTFVEDNSFEYAEKIEKIIKKNKENDKEYFTAKTFMPQKGGKKKEVKVYLGKAEDYDFNTKSPKAKRDAEHKMRTTLIRRLNEGTV